MGIFDFIKSAGEKLGLTSSEAPDPVAIKENIDKYNIGSDGVSVKVDGDRAILEGNVDNDELLEKVILAVGNTEGIASVESNIQVEGAREPVFHTVVSGDTLGEIAQKYLGNANKYTEIFEANKPMLSDPNKIYPGQTLRIPDGN